MIRQKTFKLVRPALALDIVDGKQRVVTLPAEAIVIVHVDSPDRSGLVKVSWDAQSLWMFAVDLSTRGTDITDQGESADPPGSEMLPSTIRSEDWTE